MNDTVTTDLFSHHGSDSSASWRKAGIIAAEVGAHLRTSYCSPGLIFDSSTDSYTQLHIITHKCKGSTGKHTII